jgi:3-hydroxyisobutyrate dehydrogenase
MGLPMATRLLTRQHSVRAFDLSSAAGDAFRVRGGWITSTAAGAADGAEFLVLMLPDSPAVSSVLLDAGCLERLPKGSIVIDMGSSDPAATRHLAGMAESRGVGFVDAPVSGGVRAAEAGTLTIMIGGQEPHIERCRPLLGALGGSLIHVGPLGAGHAVKALNNLLVGATLLSSVEALAIADRFGIDPERFLAVINASTGRSWSTEYKLPNYVVPQRFESGFAMALLVKDIRTALSLAGGVGAPARLAEQVLQLWEDAAQNLASDADHTSIAAWLAAQAGEITPSTGRPGVSHS